VAGQRAGGLSFKSEAGGGKSSGLKAEMGGFKRKARG